MGPLQALLIARWSPKLGTISNYQTVSEGEFSEVRLVGVLRSSTTSGGALRSSEWHYGRGGKA
jgi:hypothetical protein